MTALVLDKLILGFKIETDPYHVETLTTDDYKYPVYNVKVIPDIENYIQRLCTGDYSKSPSISGKRSCAINFSVDVYGILPAPSYFEILRACGWKQITHGSTGVSIRPDSLYNRVPATIEVAFESESSTSYSTYGGDFAPHSMNADTSGGYTASSDSEYTPEDLFHPWRAFDGRYIGILTYYVANTNHAWLKLDFGTNPKYPLYGYGVRVNTIPEPNRAPKNWTMEGSQDGTTWTILDTQVNQTSWASGELRNFTCATPTGISYQYLRINVSANNGDTYLEIAELYFYNEVPGGPRQAVYKIAGAMGRVKIFIEVGKPIRLEFSFIGSLERIYSRAYVERVQITAFDAALPPAFLGTKHLIWMGRGALLDSVEIDDNAVLNLFSQLGPSGYSGARTIDRFFSCKFKIGALMSLQVWQHGGVVAIGYDDTTGERGFLTKIKNATGTATVKGTIVCQSATVDNAFMLQTDEFDSIGVVAEAGVADGAEAWIWKNGSRAQVLFKNNVAAVREYVLLAADTDGRGTNVAVPSSNPVVAEHFKECGHTCESKNAGTDVLVLCDLHFN